MQISNSLRCLMLCALGMFWSSSLAAQNPPAKPGQKAPPAKSGDGKEMPGKTDDKKTPSKTDEAKKKTEGDGDKESFRVETFDGVQISGDFYPPKGKGESKKAPCVILLHPIGANHANSSRKEFGLLPETLQKMGLAVVTFDFRGYGDSKVVNAQKYYQYNQSKVRGKTPDRIEAKDFKSMGDLLMCVNDLVAVKIWLNKQNNAGYCNSNQVVLLGVEQSALIAAAFAVNEHIDSNRAKDASRSTGIGVGANQNQQMDNQIVGNPNLGSGAVSGGGGNIPGSGISARGRFTSGYIPANTGANPNNAASGANQNNNSFASVGPTEGEDIYAVISISSSNKLGESLSNELLSTWYTLLRDKKTKFLALYGEKDSGASNFWNKMSSIVKPAQQKNLFPHTNVRAVKGTSLVGIKLLMNEDLEVPKLLQDFMTEAVIKANTDRPWAEQKGQLKPTQVNLRQLVGG